MRYEIVVSIVIRAVFGLAGFKSISDQLTFERLPICEKR